MTFTEFSKLGCLALMVFASCATLPPVTVTPELEPALLRIRVGHKGCEDDCHRRVRLDLSIQGEDRFGYPRATLLGKLVSDDGAPEWKLYEVPVGSRVALSVFAPPHALVEEWIDVESSATQSVTILLGPKEKMEYTKVKVQWPEEGNSLSRNQTIHLIAKATGHLLGYYPMYSLGRGLTIPSGSYEVEVHGYLSGGCGNGVPRPEKFAPFRADLNLGSGAENVLKPQLGSILQLRANSPGGDANFPEIGFMESPDAEGRIVFGQEYVDRGDDLMSARLVSLEDQKVYNLTWGWRELHWKMPWERFPPGKSVCQIVPVPCGSYELIVWGPNIAEYHEEITLGSKRVTSLEISPLPASANP